MFPFFCDFRCDICRKYIRQRDYLSTQLPYLHWNLIDERRWYVCIYLFVSCAYFNIYFVSFKLKNMFQMEVVKSTVSAANNELELLNNQMMASQSSKFTRDTSAGQTMERFPTIGREVEQELKTHQWLKDT